MWCMYLFISKKIKFRMEYTCFKQAMSMKEMCINLNSIKSVMINICKCLFFEF